MPSERNERVALGEVRQMIPVIDSETIPVHSDSSSNVGGHLDVSSASRKVADYYALCEERYSAPSAGAVERKVAGAEGPKTPPFGFAQGEQGPQGERGGRYWEDNWQASSAAAARIDAGPGDGTRGPGVLCFWCLGPGLGCYFGAFRRQEPPGRVPGQFAVSPLYGKVSGAHLTEWRLIRQD